MGRVPSHGTWSLSRSGCLEDCPRGFFFRYCSGGEPDERRIRLLKRLVTPELEAGSIVHEVILLAMRAYRDDGELLYDLANDGERLYRERARLSPEVCARMREGRHLPVGTNFVAFVRDYYGHEARLREDEAVVARIRRCLDHFERSDLWACLRGIGCQSWQSLPDGGFDAMPRFRSRHGVNIWANWDFVAADPKGMIHVVDWKTGNAGEMARRKARLQLCVYATWATSTWRKPLSEVRVHPAFLSPAPPEWEPLELEREERNALGERIHADVAREADLLEPRQTRDGLAVGHWAHREAFPPRPRLQMCLRCGWRELCAEGQAVCGQTPSSRPNGSVDGDQ